MSIISRTLSVIVLFGVSLSVKAIDISLPYYEQILQALTEAPTRDQVLPWAPEGVDNLLLTSNREAPVPPMCYTDISDGVTAAGQFGQHNPCYVCHQDHIPNRENLQNDRDLQEAYSFSDAGLTNHWFNLFEDRSSRVNAISDQEILDWIDDDNYTELRQRLIDANWTGWLPDLANLQEGATAFDEHGLALDGSWWVAFNYKPMPSTFWPHNGATDDVMIRLAPRFWKKLDGSDSIDVYRANLALLEAHIKSKSRIDSLPINEIEIGIDVNDNSELEAAVTEVIVTTNQRLENNQLRNFYVGMANNDEMQLATSCVGCVDGNTPLEEGSATTIFPVGTEFLHTVRYLGVDSNGEIGISRRMKEVRYMKRYIQSRHFQLEHWYQEEAQEKEEGNLPTFLDHGHKGLAKKFGWEITGFIEAYDGRLRWNTYEENTFCMGCHTSIGSTVDKVFSFTRKVDGANGWGYINLKGMPDVANVGELKNEIETYLERVGGGTEFRSNPEFEAKFYLDDGVTVNTVALASARDVYDMIVPSVSRALQLNKAYKVITEDQDYIYGRDPSVVPPERVLAQVDNLTSPTLPAERQFDWNIALQWDQAPASGECMYKGHADFRPLTSAHVIRLKSNLLTDNDRVCAGGTVILGGELKIELVNGFSPESGEQFELIRAGKLQGNFDAITIPPSLTGQLTVTRQANSIIATVEVDSDKDGIGDAHDNCTYVANGPLIPDLGGNSQRDSNGDGFGNVCDADLDNNGLVTTADFAVFRQGIITQNPDADFNGDGVVNTVDYVMFRSMLAKTPGPGA